MPSTVIMTLKLSTFRELVMSPHPSAVARAALQRGSAAGTHGPARPSRFRRRADRQLERRVRMGGWE